MLKEGCAVKVKWGTKNKKYYIEKGYEFTKFSEEFEVKVEDLADGYTGKVVVICDYCGKEYEMSYNKYVRRVVENEFTKKCACSKCNRLKITETNLSKYETVSWAETKEGREVLSKINPSKYDINFVRQKFEERGYKLISETYKNNKEYLFYECPKHGVNKITFSHFMQGVGCKECDIDKRRRENSPYWKGGTSSLADIFRGELKKDWIRLSLERYNYTCCITGEKGKELHVHHLTPFNKIYSKVLSLKGLEVTTYSANYFTVAELEDLINLFLKESMKELGVPITKELHMEFHKKYGYHTTKEDFELFVMEKKTKKQDYKDYKNRKRLL